jgi:hypothetical protein
VEQFGGKVKIIEPGSIATDFAGRSFDFNQDSNLTEYQNIVEKISMAFPDMVKSAAPVRIVSEVIYKAATDGTSKLRYVVGKDAKTFQLLKKWLGYTSVFKMNKRFFKL